MNKVKLYLTIILLITSTLIIGEEIDKDIDKEKDRQALKEKDRQALNEENKADGLLISSADSTPFFSAAFETSSGSNKVTIKISKRERLGFSKDKYKAKYKYFSLESPLNKKEDLTDIATLSGFANSTNLVFGMKRISTSGIELRCTKEQYDRNEKEITKICTPNKESEDCKNIILSVLKQCPSPSDLDPIQIGFWGGQVKYGYESFDVFSLDDFSKSKKSENSRSLSLYYGHLWSKSEKSILTGFDYQQVFEAAKKSTFCQETEETNLFDCETGSFSNPEKKVKKLLFVEYRQKISDFAIQPRLTRDFESNTTGIDVPVFIWSDSEKNLNGGIRFGWRNDTDKFIFGIFVGTAFNHFATNID